MPEIDYAFLADAAETQPGQKFHVLGGGITRIGGRNFPLRHPHVALVVGLLVTIIAAALGAVAGSEYNILERIDLPNIPLSQDELSIGGVITAIVVVLASLLSAIAGGAAGGRYHRRVDRAHGL